MAIFYYMNYGSIAFWEYVEMIDWLPAHITDDQLDRLLEM